MANILKTGIVQGNGTPNPNLLPSTSSKEVNYSYPSSSYTDYYNQKTIIIPTGTKYTLSFWAKSTVSGDGIRAHFYNPNTTTGAVTSQGKTSSAVDGQIDFTLSSQWDFYWVTWTQTAANVTKSVIFPRMFSQAMSGYDTAKGTGIISVKMVKLEEGTVPTAWLPGSTDSYTFTNSGFNEIDNKCKIQKKGYIESNELIEI